MGVQIYIVSAIEVRVAVSKIAIELLQSFEQSGYASIEVSEAEAEKTKTLVEIKKRMRAGGIGQTVGQAALAVIFYITHGWKLLGLRRWFPRVKEVGEFCDLSGCYQFKVKKIAPDRCLLVFCDKESTYYKMQGS